MPFSTIGGASLPNRITPPSAEGAFRSHYAQNLLVHSRLTPTTIAAAVQQALAPVPTQGPSGGPLIDILV